MPQEKQEVIIKDSLLPLSIRAGRDHYSLPEI